MLSGVDSNGILRNVKVTEDGKVMVDASGGSAGVNTIIGNNSENPVPISGNVGINNTETTLYAGVMTVGTQAQTIGVSKKVTQISIANYSESADVTVEVDSKSYVIGSNIATDLPIEKVVGTIGLSSTEANTKVQYVVKGVE